MKIHGVEIEVGSHYDLKLYDHLVPQKMYGCRNFMSSYRELKKPTKGFVCDIQVEHVEFGFEYDGKTKYITPEMIEYILPVNQEPQSPEEEYYYYWTPIPWLDVRAGKFYEDGNNVETDLLNTGVMFGPGFISTPDSRLGCASQFFTDTFVRFKDKQTGLMYGMGLGHVSSAGICDRNQGKNYIYFDLGF